MTALLDHFRPPLQGRRDWHSFHNAWATFLASDLNTRLPPRFFAEPNVMFGIEIDVAAFEDEDAPGGPLASPWSPPAPTLTLPLTLVTDVVEVLVYHREGDTILAGAVEFVSPANKDRPATREAFAVKCQTYLQQGRRPTHRRSGHDAPREPA